MYKQLMWDYLKLSKKAAHTPHTLKAAFALHETFMETGNMLDTDFSKFGV
jgi:acyl-CoA hydrolase